MRSTVAGLVRAYPMTAYVVLAYVFSIVLGLGLFLSLLFGLIALLGRLSRPSSSLGSGVAELASPS